MLKAFRHIKIFNIIDKMQILIFISVLLYINNHLLRIKRIVQKILFIEFSKKNDLIIMMFLEISRKTKDGVTATQNLQMSLK